MAIPSFKVASTFRQHSSSASSELVGKRPTWYYMNVKVQQHKNIDVKMDLEYAQQRLLFLFSVPEGKKKSFSLPRRFSLFILIFPWKS